MQVGPDSPEQRAMIDAIDVDLNGFFSWLNTHVDGGMANVWVSLTGDHGIGPVASEADKLGIPAAAFSVGKLTAAVNQRLNARFSPGQQTSYILESELPYLTLDPRPFQQEHVTEAAAEDAVAEMLPEALESTLPPPPSGVSQTRLPPRPTIRHTYTRLQMAAGQLPATEESRLILHSYSPNGGWYVLLTPGMYDQPSKKGTAHYTPYSYDRHVPLAFYGSAFVPGTYRNRVAPVDIAATFASLLGVNQPSACVGHVLTEAIQPEAGSVALNGKRVAR